MSLLKFQKNIYIFQLFPFWPFYIETNSKFVLNQKILNSSFLIFFKISFYRIEWRLELKYQLNFRRLELNNNSRRLSWCSAFSILLPVPQMCSSWPNIFVFCGNTLKEEWKRAGCTAWDKWEGPGERQVYGSSPDTKNKSECFFLSLNDFFLLLLQKWNEK